MVNLPAQCPGCGDRLQVTRLACPTCNSQVEGAFAIPELLHLPADDLAFIVEFVRASGSLKEMARLRQLSYPTIRNRLDEIIAKLTINGATLEKKRHEVLDAIAKGKLSVKEGAKRLKEIDR